MRKAGMKTLCLLFLLVNLPFHRASACTRNGQAITDEGWSKEIGRVCLSGDISSNSFRSPDGRKVIVADDNGFRLKIDGAEIDWPAGRELFANGSEVSWSPTSSAFFISYADGSGLDGWTLKVYVLSAGQPINHDEINREIVRRFRAEIGCPAKTADPNVRGLGWSEDGLQVFSFAQSTVNDSCGRQGNFKGIVASLSGEPIRSFYSEAEAKRVFNRLLPYNMR